MRPGMFLRDMDGVLTKAKWYSAFVYLGSTIIFLEARWAHRSCTPSIYSIKWSGRDSEFEKCKLFTNSTDIPRHAIRPGARPSVDTDIWRNKTDKEPEPLYGTLMIFRLM